MNRRLWLYNKKIIMSKKEIYDSHFIFKNIQIKSIEKMRLFASIVDELEKEFWVRICKLELIEPFICFDISEKELDTLNNTPMEKNVRDICKQLQDFF